MKVIAPDGVAQHRAGKNISQLGKTALNPKFAVFKRFSANNYPSRRAKSAADSIKKR